MNLGNRKSLAAKVLGVGTSRITFINSRLSEIKEAITKQDIKDLVMNGAILVKEVKGRKTLEKRRNKRKVGKVKLKVNVRKKTYMTITRKLRKHLAVLKEQGKLTREEVMELRKKVRNRVFKSQANLKQHIGELKQ